MSYQHLTLIERFTLYESRMILTAIRNMKVERAKKLSIRQFRHQASDISLKFVCHSLYTALHKAHIWNC
jgi:hypothetical protein